MNNLSLRIGTGALALGVAAVLGLPPLLGASGASAPASASASVAPGDGYAVAGGCYDLYSQTAKRLVAKTGGVYVASASTPAAAYGIRMQAAALGSYVLDGKDAQFVTGASTGALGSTGTPADASVFRVHRITKGVFTVTHAQTNRPVSATPGTGRLVLAGAATQGAATRFGLRAATGCARPPEAEVGATGHTFTGASPTAAVSGTIDAHTHLTAFEFLGGDFHCGRPWSPLGVTAALPDCASIQGPQGSAAPVQNFVDYGAPEHPHDTVGWPTFKDWPGPTKFSYEGSYYTGIKRAYLAGLRLIVTDLVDNEALCDIMPMKHNPCNDTKSVELQARDLRALQDYVDAQAGGPGKGWFRIVTSPFEARKVINQGKLAIVEGVEVSHVFDCGETNHVPDCSDQKVNAGLAEFRKLGVSSFYPVHKFDNAFGGTKMDGGTEGVLINGANHLKTGHFWDIKTCTGKEQDSLQLSPADAGLPSLLTSPLGALVPGAVAPVYGPGPHCNQQGLTTLGTYLLKQMIKQHFIIEIDHMDAKTGDAALGVIERSHYSGVVSPHDWSSPEQYPRIYAAGGFVNPIAHASPEGFVKEWAADRKLRSPKFHFGFGYGSDMNGLAAQSSPTTAHPISYPFKPYEGNVTFSKERWGKKVFNLNADGVANYGMYADWLHELQILGGKPLMSDMFNGAESYLEMWERAKGVPTFACRAAAGSLTGTGLGRLRLGDDATTALMRAGQPTTRPGSAYRYCVTGAAGKKVSAVFTTAGRVGLVGASAPGDSAGGVAPGAPAARVPATATKLATGLYAGPARAGGARLVYLVRGGTITAVAVAARAETQSAARLGADLRAAGLA